MKYLPDKETHNKNEENTLKECESTLFYTIIHYFTLFYTIYTMIQVYLVF